MNDSPALVRWWQQAWARWLLWLVYATAWTRALLMPYPVNTTGAPRPFVESLFYFSKAVHISAYAVFAALSGWLPVSRRWRWLLVVALSLHAFATEYCQNYVPVSFGWQRRHPSLRDVGLDHLGVLLGMLLTWRWWRR